VLGATVARWDGAGSTRLQPTHLEMQGEFLREFLRGGSP
jgi:hypothetical protein